MSKKNTAEVVAPAAPAKRTPEEKAQRKADKAGKRATKSLTDDRAEKKASQKQTLKSAAKQLQKELDTRMNGGEPHPQRNEGQAERSGERGHPPP
jgi:hypothetical protein